MINNKDVHLGLRADELVHSPYARFYRPQMDPLPETVLRAVATGPVAPDLLPGLDEAGQLLAPGEAPIETGMTLCPNGEGRIAVRTMMPGVTPAMCAWWFGWQGSDTHRYKLWHPQAHILVAWSDDRGDTGSYLGRTSYFVDYVGATQVIGTLDFVRPGRLGIDDHGLAKSGDLAVCARLNFVRAPHEGGWVVHHVRRVPGGSEMRSRLWVGGQHVDAPTYNVDLARTMGRAPGSLASPTLQHCTQLMVQIAQKMNHLASLLPWVHTAFADA